MAGDNSATVEVEDDAVVTVDLSDNPDLAAEVEDTQPKPQPTAQPAPRERKPSAADEAAAALTQSLKDEKTRREAAEATALSERRGREEAQRLATQRENEANSLRDHAESQELTILTTGIENATRAVESAKAEMETALEAGEFSKATAAQVKLSKAASALDRLEAKKADYDAGNRKPAAPTTEGRVEAAPTTSAFERYVSHPTFAPAAQAWLRAHPECVPAEVGGNPEKNAAMMEGHYAAIRQFGERAVNTPDYFRVLEEHTGHRQPVSAAAVTTPAADPTPRQAAPQSRPQPSAPVSRDPPNANGQPTRTTRSVQLNREQQEAARISFPHLTQQQANAQYARNLIELEAEGKMGRLTH
jgi:hypothetical protein